MASPPTIITPLRPEHDRKSFDCEHSGLNDFLVSRALSASTNSYDTIYGATYVVLSEPDSAEIVAFFTINPDPITFHTGERDPDSIVTHLIKLEYIATDKKYKGQGVGESLLVYLMEQIADCRDRRAIWNRRPHCGAVGRPGL